MYVYMYIREAQNRRAVSDDVYIYVFYIIYRFKSKTPIALRRKVISRMRSLLNSELDKAPPTA